MRKTIEDLNQQRLAQIQEMAKVGYWEVDLETGGFSWSEGACAIFEIDCGAQDLTLEDFLARVHPDDYERVREKYSDLTGSPESSAITYRLLPPGNHQKYVQGKKYLDYNREGKAILCRFLIQDISTIRKDNRTEVDITHNSWKKLADAINDYIIIMDTDLRIVSANRPTTNLFDKNLDEIIGKPCHELFYGSSLRCPCTFCPVKEADSQTNQGLEISNEYLQKVLLMSATPYLDNNGDLMGYICFCKDITEYKMLETQIRQNEKMGAIGTLAGGIAHDFNNILGAIYGFTELALLESQPESNLTDNILQIKKAADRAKDLINQILTFSRETETNQQPVQLSPIIKETVKLLRSSLPSSIEIRQEIKDDQQKIMADPAHIHQIMMNLCTNAIQAIDDEKGGIIHISLKPLSIKGKNNNMPAIFPGDYLVLTIGDNGKGMKGEVLNRIFEPFFTTKEKGQGTGMGLTVVHGLVSSSNGTIKVDSNPGKGTTFNIYFPVIEDGTSKPEKPAIINLPTGNERILLVDDKIEIVTMAQKLLTYLGYSATTFTDSEQALEAFREKPKDFDLLITDHIMPRLNGYELSRMVLEIRPDLPVIICTGYQEKVSEQEMKQIGIRNILYKPLAFQQLGNTVRNALNGEN
ncbi:MAG: ATP-binding protein [Desulfobia sp.]